MEDKININEIIKPFKVEDPDAFTSYLKEVWSDLFDRVTINKNDPDDADVPLNGVTKILFNKYYELPGIIGDRLFRVFDLNNNKVLEVKEFVLGMRNLFCEEYENTSKFIFDFYDFDHDGLISKEDIRVVLSYITLAESPSVKSAGTNLSYKSRVNSQEELHNLLKKCFETVENDKMDFKCFKNIIENINSDIYLMILLFLLQNKPFSQETIKSYEKKQTKKEKKSTSPAKMIASPSKTTHFSPYKRFARHGGKRRATMQNEGEFNIILNGITDETEDKKSEGNEKETEFKERRRKKRRTLEQNLIKMEGINTNNDNKIINENRIKDLTRKKNKNDKKYDENEIEITPAFKQNMDKKYGENKDKNKSKAEKNEKSKRIEGDVGVEDNDIDDEDLNFALDSDEEDEEVEEEENTIKYEGILYKCCDGKMKKLWFKLVHKDLYYYKNKDDKNHKGMHNLSGLFFHIEEKKVVDGKTYFSFSIQYPAKTRVYYCDKEEEFKIWMEKLKKATGYTNLLDLYQIKEKLGNGKFGLVKLGINKINGQKVAVKIMNKNNMDSSDLELVRTEIEILKICQHPNIIRLYDILENIDYIYIIMEYCSGGDLFSYLEKRDFRLNEERAAELMHKICAAVFYIHSYGIAHRDLKPENILMTSEDDKADIRILDFGLSKIIGPGEKCTEPYGTLTYCAPEIIVDEPYSKAVDLWSLGVMTYLILSGRLPFNSQDENEIARQVAFDPPNFTKLPVWEKISKEAKNFIKRLLEKEPKHRMNIKQALDHEWFKKFTKINKVESKSNFEKYTTVVNKK